MPLARARLAADVRMAAVGVSTDDRCERLNRVLEYARDELQWLHKKHLSGFASPDHAVVPRANPPQPLIKDITKRLFDAGFNREQIARLVVDRPEPKDAGDKKHVELALRVSFGA